MTNFRHVLESLPKRNCRIGSWQLYHCLTADHQLGLQHTRYDKARAHKLGPAPVHEKETYMKLSEWTCLQSCAERKGIAFLTRQYDRNMTTRIPQAHEIKRFGLTEVYRPTSDEAVDIVFVHGLNGHPYHTWTSEEYKIYWPAQLLPPVIEKEKAGILVYGYDADVFAFTDGVSNDKIQNHAEHLTAELFANRRRRNATERPVIFVAHSLGGLVVKRALIYSSEIRGNHTEHLRSIFVSTYGILFLGTPHQGSDIAKWGSKLEKICDAVMPNEMINSQSELINALRIKNETLLNIDRQFIQLCSKFRIYFFHEATPTSLNGTSQYIVDEESASSNIQDVERAGIQRDHFHMCKFENDDSPGFSLIAEGIQRYAIDAPKIVSSRWHSERAEQRLRKEAEAEELLKNAFLRSGNATLSNFTSRGS